MIVDSEVQICNGALGIIGGFQIQTLEDNSSEARLCKTFYPISRDTVLTMANWGFATSRAVLPILSSAKPVHTYANYLQLPSDFLHLQPFDDGFKDFKLEGKYIASDETTLNIVYTKKVTDVSFFHPLYVEALQFHLAWKMAFKFVQSTSTRAEIHDMFVESLRKADSRDSQQEAHPDLRSDEWENARSA